MNVMWCPEGDPGTEKGQEVKTKKKSGGTVDVSTRYINTSPLVITTILY